VHENDGGLKLRERGLHVGGTVGRFERKLLGKSFLPERFLPARSGAVDESHGMAAALQFARRQKHVGFSTSKRALSFMDKKQSHLRRCFHFRSSNLPLDVTKQ
jgi:hypothetical protein